jgi:hypothetical protein
MANTLTQVNPQVYQGPVMKTAKVLITNGVSWKAGQFLTTSAGALVACATNAVDVKYYALKDQADPGNATTLAEVGVIDPAHVFIINSTSTAPVLTYIGLSCCMNVASNVCTATIGTAANPAFKIVDVMSTQQPITDSVTDVNGRVLVQVLTSVIQA